MPDRSPNRRRFLKVATVTGAVGIAGCIGDEDADPDEDDPLDDNGNGLDDDEANGDGNGEDADADYHLDVGTSTGGTMDVGLAVEQAVADVSDTLSYATIESPGYVGSTYRMAEGAFDAGFVDQNTMDKARTGSGGFEDEPVDQLPWQGLVAFPYSIYVMARDGTGIETFDDLAGASVYPAEPGFSTRETTLDVFQEDPVAGVYEEMDIVDADVDDAPGLMEEEQIDAAIAYGTPGIGNTGWVVEYDARVDVHYVEHTDELLDAIEGYPGTGLTIYDDDPADTFNWDQDIDADEIAAWDLTITIAFHPEADDEAVYELCRVGGEENDAIRQAEERFTPENPEDLVGEPLEDYPVHPGAAEYYQDEGVWDDDWVVGDRDQIGEYFE